MTAAEWRTGVREGYRTKTIRHGSATIEIHRPILAEEEQDAREEEVKQAIGAFLKGVINSESSCCLRGIAGRDD